MSISGETKRLAPLAVAALLAIVALPTQAQYGGMGGFGGMGAGIGAGMGSMSGGGGLGEQSMRLAFRPWFSANGTYSESLGTATTTSAPTRTFYGYGATAGMSGGRSWARTSMAGFYTGSYQHYNGLYYRRGLSQVGGFSVRHQVSTRTTMFANQFAGSSNGGFGYGAGAGVLGGWGMAGTGVLADLAPGGVGFSDPASNGLVDNEVFGSRVNFTGTSGGVTFEPSLRWSYSVLGSAAFVRRKGVGLNDLNSFSGGAQASFRIDQSTRIGALYMAGRFSYPNMFGGNLVQQVGVFLSRQITPQTTISVMGGTYQFRTNTVGMVAIDPSLAGLLGQTATLEVLERKRMGWMGSATVSRAWRSWSSQMTYSRGASPGNGLILASSRDMVMGGASTSLGRVSLGASASYYRYTGLVQRGASTQSISMGGSVGVRLFTDMYLGSNIGYSRYETNTTAQQWRRFISVHLTYSPREAAFRF